MPIKYRYALDEDHQVVDVEDLTAADRKDYECIACGHVLRPVMGEIRRKHFRHQADVKCSGETYLHRLGKLVFRQVYRQCLDTGTAFEIRLACRWICTNCENGPCEIESRLVTYDLTAYFSNIVLETPNDGFIPDLMLLSERGERVYIEIAVTHRSTEDKRTSGHRIIELTAENQADLGIIRTRVLSEDDERVEFIGFDVKPKKSDFSNECVQTRVPVPEEMPYDQPRQQLEARFSKENYLHRLGKRMFQRVYRQCLDTGVPFEIELSRRRLCTACERLGPCSVEGNPVRYDLTARFSEIVHHPPDVGFAPDLMLSNERGGMLYVKIMVGQETREEKRGADHRVIELSFEDESDLQIIKSRVLSRTDRRVRLIGFDLEPLEGDFSDKCIRTRHVFSVWESAEVYLETKTVAAFREEYLDKSKRFYFTFVSYGSGQTYLEALERAYLMGIKVRSCYLCLHHRLLKAPQHKVAPHRIFCDYWDEAWSPTFAVDCEHYSPGKAALHIYHGGKIDQDVLENRQFYCSRGMAALLGRSIDMLEKD